MISTVVPIRATKIFFQHSFKQTPSFLSLLSLPHPHQHTRSLLAPPSHTSSEASCQTSSLTSSQPSSWQCLHVVAFSGGVDSSLVAFLLKQALTPPHHSPSSPPTPPPTSSSSRTQADTHLHTHPHSLPRVHAHTPSDSSGSLDSSPLYPVLTPSPSPSPPPSPSFQPFDQPHSQHHARPPPPPSPLSLPPSPPQPPPSPLSPAVVACIGVSPALPASQLQLARQVAGHIGVALWEVREGTGGERGRTGGEKDGRGGQGRGGEGRGGERRSKESQHHDLPNEQPYCLTWAAQSPSRPRPPPPLPSGAHVRALPARV